jgi:hypothetical protein
MPTAEHYDTELARYGGQPGMIGGAPVIGGQPGQLGKLMVPTGNELQKAMDNAAQLPAMHQKLKYAQHIALRWKHDPDKALALQDKIDQIEPYMGSSEKLRESSLAQNFLPLKTVYEQTAQRAALAAARLQAQFQQQDCRLSRLSSRFLQRLPRPISWLTN